MCHLYGRGAFHTPFVKRHPVLRVCLGNNFREAFRIEVRCRSSAQLELGEIELEKAQLEMVQLGELELGELEVELSELG